MVTQEITHMISGVKEVVSSFALEQKKKNKYVGPILTGIAVFLIAGVGYLLYRWYYVNAQQKAQMQFARCVAAYEAKDANWQNVEQMCKNGAEQYSSSALAPYFLAYQADALVQQGKRDQALEVFDSVVKKTSKSSYLYHLLKMKHALLALDSADTTRQIQGLAELIEVAHDDKNINRDAALYHLGSYYWATDKQDDARTVWGELVELFRHEVHSPSLWAQQAKEKLALISQ